MRGFVGIDLGVEGAPDETTVCKFRHLLERNKLGKVLLTAVNEHLRRSGIKIANGTIVDATIIGAPSSTKNQDGKRDPEMHQTAKGQQWYFGMKAHVGVDSRTKLIHTVWHRRPTWHDRDALPHLLHGKETRVWGDQGYQGQSAVIHEACAARQGLHEQALPLQRPDRRGREGKEPQQVAGAREGRARVRRDQEHLRLPQGALPRPGQEPAPAGGHRGAHQSVHGATTVAEGVGDVSVGSAKHDYCGAKAPRQRAEYRALDLLTRFPAFAPIVYGRFFFQRSMTQRERGGVGVLALIKAGNVEPLRALAGNLGSASNRESLIREHVRIGLY